MTSATDELRRLLDERGVEWWQSANTLGCVFTRWHSPLFGDEVVAMENGKEGLVLFDHFMTPAQAIDATLGPGTCRDLSGTGANGEQVFNCSECGCVLSLYDRDGSNNLCTSFIFDYPRYCPECGRRVVECD